MHQILRRGHSQTLGIMSFCSLLFLVQCSQLPGDQAWNTYRGSVDAQQYSVLKKIDTSNVHLLKPAWIFHTGDSMLKSTIECNPIIVNGLMYVTSPSLHLIALQAATGEEVWRFRPFGKEVNAGVNRGVTYWQDGKDGSIFFPAGKFMFAVNARTGRLIEKFGQKGKIDLRSHLGKDTAMVSISLTTPGIVYKDLLILGSATGEGYDASPGHIRAYDAHTGALKWIFHTIPEPGEEGYDTWYRIDGENYGGTNNWGGMSLDEKRGIVYIATGSPTYDFYGANRIGTNLYGNCILALEAVSGKKIWHYQAVKHDIWDYDLPCAPTLATINWKGSKKDILIQPTKMGELILLDRATGTPLLNVVEAPVPWSDVPAEKSNPTQSMHQGLLLSTQGWDSTYITDISDSARDYVLNQSRKYRQAGMYTPPSLEGTIAQPGTRGGMGWSGISYDQSTHTAYVNCNDFPMILQLEKLRKSGAKDGVHQIGEQLYKLNCSNCHGADRKGSTDGVPGLIQVSKKISPTVIKKTITLGKGLMPAFPQFTAEEIAGLISYFSIDVVDNGIQMDSTPSAHDKYVLKGFRIFTDREGYPASKPPWGTLNAVDITSGRIKWKVPLGYYPKLMERGVPPTGTQNFGGCVATAGGLVFIGATADEKFRAFNAETGAELWSYALPAGGYATPSVYEVDGKQYVVIAAGGGNRNNTKSSDTYIAFTIP